MRELMAHSVSVWESDPLAYSYHAVGYMQISPEVMHAQVGSIYEQQQAIGYESSFIEGERESLGYMKTLFSRLAGAEHHVGAAREARRLREQHGGAAGLAKKATALGVEIIERRGGQGLSQRQRQRGDPAVQTSAGTIACDEVVVGVGPWINAIWNMLELPRPIRVKGRDGTDARRTCACGTTWRCRKARSASIRTIPEDE